MTSLKEDVAALLGQAKRSRQRRMLRLIGADTWLHEQSRLALEGLGLEDARTLRRDRLYRADQRAERVRDRLGAELSALVVDASVALDADALGAALGMVKGGGLVVWLQHASHPELDLAAPSRSAFAMHVERALDHAKGVITRSQAGERTAHAVVHEVVAEPTRFFEWGACTFDQERAVSALLGLLDRSAHPVVLSAHRGRGKSSALGLFVGAALARDPSLRIAVTAPHPRGTDTLLARVPGEQGRVRVVPAFELAQGRVDADLVLVDEAAGLSVELLSAIVDHHPRVAFATTVHGYEGSGQGFRVRFMARLLHTFPRTREVILDTPVRWEQADPVEAFAARALVLDAPTALGADTTREYDWSASAPAYEVTRIDRGQLSVDEALLRALFGTFVLAHYRTTPSDLVHLLDDEGVRVWVARENSEVVAALWAVEEGGFRTDEAERIARGAFRPRGHMLPEALARHLDEPLAASARGLRVVRIAVAPNMRRSGVGRALLKALVTSAHSDGFDYVGAGFAATADVISFWQANDCSLVHIGSKRGAASGEVSALVLHGVSAEMTALVARLRVRFLSELADRLRDGLHDLGPAVVACAWHAAEQSDEAVSESERQRLAGYINYAVPYEAVVAVLHRFVLARARSGAFEPLMEGQALLIAKVLQGRAWPEVRRIFRLASVAEAMRAVRRAVAEEAGIAIAVVTS